MVKHRLERKWLHVQVFEGEVYVFFDDGHWEDSSDHLSREDWVFAAEFKLSDLDKECWLGSVDGNGTFRARICLDESKPTIYYGKFGMPYGVWE